jgi:two-component system copper resistance phosphate regulon response regulator CusR
MRILLVEDEPNAARMLAKGLRQRTYAVDVADDGEEALYQASVNDFDLVILDVLLPLKDGFEVCRELRAAGSVAPVLMLTARDAVQDRIAGLDLGADDYLVKPFDFHELLARVRALLRRGATLRPETLTVADLVIDTRAQQVRRVDRQIELTAKEYALVLAVPFALLGVAAIGWFLARKSLAPVVAMSERARRISAENLDQGLPVVTILCGFGALLALYFTGTALNISSFMGAIMVIGIVHKNGILMLDSEQHFTAQGLELREAIFQAGRRRLRPILMTALATIFGMLPLAWGIGSGAELLRPLAIAVIGGVTVSMVLSRLITPVLFYLLRKRGL